MDIYDKYLEESSKVADEQKKLKNVFLSFAEETKKRVADGGGVYFCGNGGSAADSQHLAAELIGRFKRNRMPLKSLALTTDTSIITAISNDFSFDDIFTRQIEGLCSEKDVLIGISTSGESRNVLNALNLANKMSMLTISFTNNTENSISKVSEFSLQIPSTETGIIQQGHITFGQLLCMYLEENLT
jgi:D-sedoheptulose 7-phosphate isomerase